MRPSHARVPEQSFENGLDGGCAPEHALDARAAAPETENGEIADGRVPRGLPVDDDRDAALEERLADEELPAPGELADG